MKPPDMMFESLQRIVAEESDKELVAKAEDMLRDWNSGKKICLLKKAICGLRQAGRRWHAKLSDKLKSHNIIEKIPSLILTLK